MENFEIHNQELGQVIKLDFDHADSLTIHLKDQDSIVITDHHDQDCCERVYADFSALKYHASRIEDKDFERLVIKGVPAMGFLMCFEVFRYQPVEAVKVFIPCYNEQNGYYSDNLSLIIKQGGSELLKDISAFVEDNSY